MPLLRLVLAALLLVIPAVGACVTAEQSAAELFAKYVRLGSSYDASLADLYADTALITNKRTYPHGEVREITIPAPQYKQLIRAAMPMARSRGDMSTYSEVTYMTQGERVRISATRFSELKQYKSPLTLVVGASSTGDWLILEEHSESRP
ncbi:hypothetical protein [Pseudomarimonas salicorniae]|uniref:DUF4440 domain-containing protein n=1 Tax=Pseudomarimonas salicorniae TaxID=2933270 RepID=A0ABT0GM77_9GAMM|nr:hypothetical protein [Lysobacter sp. CAU 1642]MCK7595615.1 hypothetical protein [Lysobacter sp. CAU 1642]